MNAEELNAGLMHGDKVSAKGLGLSNLDKDYFDVFLQKHFNTSLDDLDIPLGTLLENMNLMQQGVLNIAGALLFTRNPNFNLPSFIVKAVAFPSNDTNSQAYLDSQDMSGKMLNMFRDSLGFVSRNLHHVQATTISNRINPDCTKG